MNGLAVERAAEVLREWADNVSPAAQLLVERFWPGPPTLVLRRSPRASLVATGGGETVALRVPARAVALKLLTVSGGGIAAPSANRFGSVSPTRAVHVRHELGAAVDFVLDAGPCEVGIESTIVDATHEDPVILRPGGVTREELERVLGRTVTVRRGCTVIVASLPAEQRLGLAIADRLRRAAGPCGDDAPREEAAPSSDDGVSLES